MRKRMHLQLFEDGAGAGSGGQGGNAGTGGGGQGTNTGATYSYEQAEEIASARAIKAERAALANYFRSQGMTEEQITTAINDFKSKQKESQPNATKLQQDLDDANKKIQQMVNEKVLTGKGVKAEDIDYVMFKVSQLVDDKTTFEKAAEKYLKENPRFVGGNAYRISTSAGSSSEGSGGNMNTSINDRIRAAARR